MGSGVSTKTKGIAAKVRVLPRAGQKRVEAWMGHVATRGRYHLARTLEDDYEVTDEVLGSGMSGEVRLAVSRQHVSGQTFAVKSFDLTGQHAQFRPWLADEVEAFLSVDHPNIVRLVDVYQTETQLHLVMECLTGGELFHKISRTKRQSEREVADAVRQMLLAASHVHSRGIVHRDLKPQNFLYAEKDSNRLKLIDFGLCKVWDFKENMEDSCGTLKYMAPEVLQKKYTNKCDIWSLGVTTYTLLNGRTPFNGTMGSIKADIRKGVFLFNFGVSKEAKHFTEQLLHLDPDLRPSAQEALRHPWIVQQMEQLEHSSTSSQDDAAVVKALATYTSSSKMRQFCLSMLAWSLPDAELENAQQQFLALDKDGKGMVAIADIQRVVVETLGCEDRELLHMISEDMAHDGYINYSEFLAAMVSMQPGVNHEAMQGAFHRFDTSMSGYITREDLKGILHSNDDLGCSSEDITKFMSEVDADKDGKITYQEFSDYLCASDSIDSKRRVSRIVTYVPEDVLLSSALAAVS
eukprot:TRINITY_DN40764_c0_g1_i1.p1 TRINITY_DN40764_c0_g1~~TRINITY_DN40764_c0_g1_i1.p1  ORF type:complete len:521 (-),score=155.91 TRINITY_DN40764_c0_g1_i1:111-1673(-)